MGYKGSGFVKPLTKGMLVKNLFALALSMLISVSAFASSDTDACGISDPQCRTVSKTCEAYFRCEDSLLRSLRRAVEKIEKSKDYDLDKLFNCRKARDNQENHIDALNTTIECVDSKTGIQLGG
jgi:hypothetical protein